MCFLYYIYIPLSQPSGSLFVSGCIYYHRSRDLYVLSFGYRKWATVGCPLKKETLGDKDWTANLPQKKWFCLGFQSNVNPRINKPVGCLVEGVSFTFKYQTITIWEYHPINKPWFHQSRVDITARTTWSHHRRVSYLVICPMARDLSWMVNFDLDGDSATCACQEIGPCFAAVCSL